MNGDWTDLCALDEVADPGAKGFIGGTRESPLPGFVVRSGDAVHAYLNVCPHAGRPLNWRPDAFLTKDGSQIMCSAHGALFEPTTGLCIAGPCSGASLRRIDARIDAGIVQVASGGLLR